MAPRKQAKQPAAESTQVAADGNVTPPKKRKTAAKAKSSPREPAKIKAAPRQSKRTRTAPQEAAVVLTPKNLRSRNKNVVVVPETTKDVASKTAASKTNNSRQKKKTRNDDVDEEEGEEEEEEEVVEKKVRGKSVKKAGTKPTTGARKAPVVRKRRGETANDQVEEGLAANGKIFVEENPPAVKRATRRGRADGAQEKNVAPVTRTREPPKRQRTRRNAEPAETDGDERVKKTAKVTVKEKLPRNVKELELSENEETETETSEEQSEQNTIKDDKLKTNMKNSRKRNAKKTTSKAKRNVETEEDNEAEAEEPVIPEIQENGETEVPQAAEAKQKKRNSGKANIAATNEKIEIKKREKKGQTVVTSMNEKKDTVEIQDEMNKTMNVTFDALDEINISSNDISLNKTNDSQEENHELENMETVKENNGEMLKLETSNTELQRSASFLCFD